LPVYNEEKIVEQNVLEVYAYLQKNFSKFELVVVDDSSNDDTPKILGSMIKKKSNLRIIRFNNGPSRRENLGVALKTSKYPLTAYMDLDLSVKPALLAKCLSEINDGADIAIGSRRVPGAKVNRELSRLLWSTAYHRTVRLLFRSKVHDYQCGFKVFKKEVLNDLLEKTGYDSSFNRGWFWDAEILIAAEKEGYTIKEIPVEWNAGKQSSFKLGRELKVPLYILSLWLGLNKTR
jgi:glycosyltransferase AglD